MVPKIRWIDPKTHLWKRFTAHPFTAASDADNSGFLPLKNRCIWIPPVLYNPEDKFSHFLPSWRHSFPDPLYTLSIRQLQTFSWRIIRIAPILSPKQILLSFSRLYALSTGPHHSQKISNGQPAITRCVQWEKHNIYSKLNTDLHSESSKSHKKAKPIKRQIPWNNKPQ